MRRIVLVIVLILVFAVMTFASMSVIPSWATLTIERGEELPLGTQIVIASGVFWSRYFVFIGIVFAVAIGWILRSALRRGDDGA